MSLESILKNVYSFLEVLQSALSDKVRDWDTPMIDNAIKWATYAQQLYNQAKGKPYQPDLDRQIQHIGQLPWSLGHIQINLELMEHAESLMKESLLQNCWLSIENFEYVLNLYGLNTEEGMGEVLKICQRLSQQKASLDVFETLNSASSTLDGDVGGPGSTGHREGCARAQARLLVGFIARALGKTPQHKKDRTLQFLKKKIAAFASKPGAIMVLGYALSGKYPDILTSGGIEDETKTVILHTVMDLPVHYKREIKGFLQPAVTMKPASQPTT